MHEEDKGRYGGLKRNIKAQNETIEGVHTTSIHWLVWSRGSGTARTTTEAACLRV